jgi:hypothetical protein
MTLSLKWPNKDPNEVLDYQINWARRVQSSRTPDDTIESSTWIVPDGITSPSDTFTDTTTTIWLSGGTVDETYELTNRVVTTEGRTMDESVTIKIKER